jgi:hypothetical protein
MDGIWDMYWMSRRDILGIHIGLQCKGAATEEPIWDTRDLCQRYGPKGEKVLHRKYHKVHALKTPF